MSEQAVTHATPVIMNSVHGSRSVRGSSLLNLSETTVAFSGESPDSAIITFAAGPQAVNGAVR